MAELLEIRVPDIGDFDEVEVVEILVAQGDQVEFEDPLVSIESDKATMEIPSTAAGTIVELKVAEGDRVSEGSLLVVLEASEAVAEASSDGSEEGPDEVKSSELPRTAIVSESTGADDAAAAGDSGETHRARPSESAATLTAPPRRAERKLSPAAANPVPDRTGLVHASPLVRRYARELGVPLDQAEGTGEHGRVLVDDLKRRVRERFAGGEGGSGIPAVRVVDHAAFGPIREQKLTRIQKVSGPNLQRSWLNAPHVTQHDSADVTDLERFRRESQAAATERGLKLSPLLFVMKAVVIALEEFPTLRASLAPEGDRLVIKEYFHLGIAVDTEDGLVVPVVRDVDRKGVFELADELAAIAARAREGKLRPDDLQGACFTISSLGGIGGTAFTPIVNAPEVAILGLSRSRVEPTWQGGSPLDAEPRGDIAGGPPVGGPAGDFVPRIMLPLSLSYDHRVIDGALAARFTTRLSRLLANPLQLLL